MKLCQVKNCVYSAPGCVVPPEIAFYAFPGDPERRRKWEKACATRVFSIRAYICSRHFAPEAIRLRDRLMPNYTNNKPHLVPDAVPTIDLPIVPMPLSHLSNRMEREVRARKELTAELLRHHSVQREKEMIAAYKDNHKDIGVQTEPELDPLNTAIARLKRTESQLIRANKTVVSLQSQKDELESELQKYKMLFTPGQQRMLINQRNVLWSDEDISMAASLHAAGSEAYKLLQERGFPLPTLRTLKRKAKAAHIDLSIVKVESVVFK